MLKSLRKKPSSLDVDAAAQKPADHHTDSSSPEPSLDLLHPSTAAAPATSPGPSSSRISFPTGDHPKNPTKRPPSATGPAPATSRFRRHSLLRARYRSDPLLSTTYRLHAASDGAVDDEHAAAAPAPTIGITAPPPKSQEPLSKRSRAFLRPFQTLVRSVSSNGPPSNHSDTHLQPSSSMAHHGKPHVSFDDGSRPSLQHLAVPADASPRKTSSESSDRPRPSATLFRFPIRKKKPEPLFPLPAKVTKQQSPSKMNNTPESSVPASEPSTPDDEDEDPTRVSVSSERHSFNGTRSHGKSRTHNSGSATLPHNFTSPLGRHNSTASTFSSNSGFAPPTVFSRDHRSRSGTLSSLPGRMDPERVNTPMTEDSGRNSTASTTLGRNSIAGLRSLTSRLRHPSEIVIPRRGSPGSGAPGTPSNNNSLAAISQETLVIPERAEGETAGRYYNRLEQEMPKKSIALVLSKSTDAFNHDVLRSLMRTFKFYEEPMDISLRKFLWEIDLPGEAQQIDRVMTAFAERYHECNPHIFDTADEAYFVAYSLIILHSDLFNRNNKSKMQRYQYQKNTGGRGIPDEILGYFYDNIGYTEFVAQNPDDNESVNKPKAAARKVRKVKAKVAPEINEKTGKVDPYEVILSEKTKLDVLRPSLKDVLNLEDSYSYLGTTEKFDMAGIRRAFSAFGILQIISARSRPEAYTSQATTDDPTGAQPGVIDIRVAKVGTLWRKDEKRRKTRSKWQRWGAILTPSQLYLFRDVSWVESLITQASLHHRPHLHRHHKPVIFQPPLTEFRCDFHIAMADAVALQDMNYKKHKHSFLLARRGTLSAERPQDQYFDEVLLAENENELNDWLCKLNYAAAHNASSLSANMIITSPTSAENPSDEATGSSKPDTDHADQDDKSREPRSRQSHIAPVNSESLQLTRRVTALEENTSMAVKKLNENLKTARHLQILAPFPDKTRRDLLGFGARLSHNIKWSRFDVWRLKCYRDLLIKDLQDGENGLMRPPTIVDRTRGISPSGTVDEVPLSEAGSKLDRPDSAADSRIEEAPRMDDTKSSVSVSVRSDERDSREPSLIEGIDEAFETPDDFMSRSASPGEGPFKLPPLALSTRALSATSASAEKASLDPAKASPAIEHRTSLTSIQSSHARQSSVSESGAETPAAASSTAARDMERRGSILPASERDRAYGSPDSRKRSGGRKGLQRTLRESRESVTMPLNRGSRRLRDSISSANGEEPVRDTTGLTRKGGSFTIHGKKASVVTLGSEWANISAEERLRTRQQNLNDETKSLLSSTKQADGGPPDSDEGPSDSATNGVAGEQDDAASESAHEAVRHSSIRLVKDMAKHEKHHRARSSESGFYVDAPEDREHETSDGEETGDDEDHGSEVPASTRTASVTDRESILLPSEAEAEA